MQSLSSSGEISNTDLLGSSPNLVYTIFLLRRAEKYLDAMMDPDNINIDTATQSLFAFCPDDEVRKKLWDNYAERKESKGAAQASILTVGEFQSHLTKVLELVKKSYAGF